MRPPAAYAPEFPTPQMKNHILLCAVGSDRPEILKRVTRRVLDTGCNVDESRMASLGREIAMMFLVSGTWDAIAKLEAALPRVAEEDGIEFVARRTEARDLDGGFLPYAVEVIAADKPGIVHHLVEFFSARGILIDNFASTRYTASQTGTDMFSAHLAVSIPSDLHIAALRDEFMEFCDGLNLDAIIEPIKN